MTKKIKVLVTDDSAFMRKMLSDMLQSSPRIEVVGTARNGEDALKKVEELKPDVMTLDVEMPILDGIQTLRELNKRKLQLPVIMLSSTTQIGANNTMIALEEGAIDFIPKPSGSISLDIHKVKDELVTKVITAYASKSSVRKKEDSVTQQENVPLKPNSKVITPIYTEQQISRRTARTEELRGKGIQNVLLIGTSTGGPRALQKLLTTLPKLEDTAILIVQHMPPTFTRSLADRLNSITEHQVKEAEHGEMLKAGSVYIAPGGYHMTIKPIGKHLAIELNQEAQVNGHRPSVDVLFASARDIQGYHLLAVVMTGMGKDGTEGLRQLKQVKQVFAVAEHQDTCIVYGMPKSIIDAQLADDIQPLEAIYTSILKRLHT